MKGKSSLNNQDVTSNALLEAVNNFIAEGGIIHVIPDGKASESVSEDSGVTETLPGSRADDRVSKLKALLARGAGFSSLQYSLKMNREEIRRLASENGLKIPWKRPCHSKRNTQESDRDHRDRLAGEITHHASLDLTLPEIASALSVPVSLARSIVREYRISLRTV